MPLLKGEDWGRSAPIGFASREQYAYNGTRYKFVEGQLYDMIEDPYETNDLSQQYPDIAEKYLEELLNWYESCRNSFEGSEYGSMSFERVKQTFPELDTKAKK